MKRTTLMLTITGACLLSAAVGGGAGWCLGLSADAISRREATAIALEQTGLEQVRSVSLVRMNGKPVWKAELLQAGVGGITEVHLHAMTGGLLEVRHESAKKADAELTKLAQQLGITAKHVVSQDSKTTPVRKSSLTVDVNGQK